MHVNFKSHQDWHERIAEPFNSGFGLRENGKDGSAGISVQPTVVTEAEGDARVAHVLPIEWNVSPKRRIPICRLALSNAKVPKGLQNPRIRIRRRSAGIRVEVLRAAVAY